MKEAIDKEWEGFREERAKTLDEIMEMRRSVATVQDSVAAGKRTNGGDVQGKAEVDATANGDVKEEGMEVDDGAKEGANSKKEQTPATIEGDEVEY